MARNIFSENHQPRVSLAARVVYHFGGKRDIWNFSLKHAPRLEGRAKYGYLPDVENPICRNFYFERAGFRFKLVPTRGFRFSKYRFYRK